MKLSRYTLKNITVEEVTLPEGGAFELPEKALQFGTRGLIPYQKDEATKTLFISKVPDGFRNPHINH